MRFGHCMRLGPTCMHGARSSGQVALAWASLLGVWDLGFNSVGTRNLHVIQAAKLVHICVRVVFGWFEMGGFGLLDAQGCPTKFGQSWRETHMVSLLRSSKATR